MRKIDSRFHFPCPLIYDLKFSPPVRPVGVCACTNLKLLRLLYCE